MIKPNPNPERQGNPAPSPNELAFTDISYSPANDHGSVAFAAQGDKNVAASPLNQVGIPRAVGELPLLTLEQLSENRIGDLRKLYQEKGVDFDTESELINRIRNDWNRYRSMASEHTTLEDSTLALEPIVVECDQKTFKIYGAIHSWTSGREYHDLYNKKIAEHSSLVAEQGMGMYFRLPEGGVTCADWSVISSREYFMIGFMAGFDLREPLSMIAGLVLPFQKQQAEESTATGWHFHNEVDGLPDQVAREIQVSEGRALDFIQRRSQYQAEFSRAWVKEVGSECGILVGGLHATEIRDYLRYGVEDAQIIERAKGHARLAQEAPFTYQAMYVYDWARGLVLSSVGVALGLSPWIGLAIGARKIIFGF